MTMVQFNSLFLLLCATTFLFKDDALVTAQSCGPTRERWAWTDHTCAEQDDYIEAVIALKQNGTYDEFVRVHRDMNSISHGVAEFLPWHRWFIYTFEDALRAVSRNPCITIPFWDWEDSTVFDEDTFDWFDGSYDEDPNRCKWETLTGDCLRRDMDQSISMWRSGQILGMIMNYDQYADEFSQNSRRNNGFRAAMEGGPHTAPHSFLGGPMLNMLSPTDPLFFVHHANVDRIWSLWQDYYDHDQLDISLYNTPEHYEGSLLDEPMRFSRNRMFVMENGNSPTPRDVLSNNDVVNVLYKNDQLARRLSYDPNPNWIESAPFGSDQVWCDRASVRRERKNRELQRGAVSGDRNTLKAMTTTTEEFWQQEGIEAASTSSLRGREAGTKHYKVPTEKHVERTGLSKYSTFVSVEKCLELNDFIDQDEQRIWDKNCQEIPLSSTLAERMAFLAQDECKERGNPFSASPEIIRTMNMDNELATFECFHLPDQYD